MLARWLPRNHVDTPVGSPTSPKGPLEAAVAWAPATDSLSYSSGCNMQTARVSTTAEGVSAVTAGVGCGRVVVEPAKVVNGFGLQSSTTTAVF